MIPTVSLSALHSFDADDHKLFTKRFSQLDEILDSPLKNKAAVHQVMIRTLAALISRRVCDEVIARFLFKVGDQVIVKTPWSDLSYTALDESEHGRQSAEQEYGINTEAVVLNDYLDENDHVTAVFQKQLLESRLLIGTIISDLPAAAQLLDQSLNEAPLKPQAPWSQAIKILARDKLSAYYPAFPTEKDFESITNTIRGMTHDGEILTLDDSQAVKFSDLAKWFFVGYSDFNEHTGASVKGYQPVINGMIISLSDKKDHLVLYDLDSLNPYGFAIETPSGLTQAVMMIEMIKNVKKSFGFTDTQPQQDDETSTDPSSLH